MTGDFSGLSAVLSGIVAELAAEVETYGPMILESGFKANAEHCPIANTLIKRAGRVFPHVHGASVGEHGIGIFFSDYPVIGVWTFDVPPILVETWRRIDGGFVCP